MIGACNASPSSRERPRGSGSGPRRCSPARDGLALIDLRDLSRRRRTRWCSPVTCPPRRTSRGSRSRCWPVRPGRRAGQQRRHQPDRSRPSRRRSTQWRRVIDVNLAGRSCSAGRSARQCWRRGSGSIVNVASIAGLRGRRRTAPPTTLEARAGRPHPHAGRRMGRSRRARQRGVPRLDQDRDGRRDRGAGATPTTTSSTRCRWRRFARPADVAAAIAFLADPARSGFVNGVACRSTAAGPRTRAGIRCASESAADAVFPGSAPDSASRGSDEEGLMRKFCASRSRSPARSPPRPAGTASASRPCSTGCRTTPGCEYDDSGSSLTERVLTLKQMGVGIVRFTMRWDEVAPTRPANAREPVRPGLRVGPRTTRSSGRCTRGRCRSSSRSTARRSGRTAARPPNWAPDQRPRRSPTSPTPRSGTIPWIRLLDDLERAEQADLPAPDDGAPPTSRSCSTPAYGALHSGEPRTRSAAGVTAPRAGSAAASSP